MKGNASACKPVHLELLQEGAAEDVAIAVEAQVRSD
jgi:hypothetical protein